MYIGNLILLILSIPLVGIFVKILRVRPAILAPITALITILGVYTINNSVFDIFVMIAFGILGYLMKKTGFEPGPLVLAFVLGSLMESSFRRSMLIFDGDPTGFLTRPISGHHPGLPRAGAGTAAAQAGVAPAYLRTAPPALTTSTRKQACDDRADRLRAHPHRRGGPRGRAWPRPPSAARTW